MPQRTEEQLDRAFNFRLVFRSWNFALTMIWLLLQQTIVAGSIYFLGAAAVNIEQMVSAVPWFVGFVLLSVGSYVPGILANRQNEIWHVEVVQSFQSRACSYHPFFPRHYPEKELGNTRKTIFASTSLDIIRDLCYYIFTLASSSMNAIFVLIVVAGFTDFRIIVTYFVSFVLVLVFFRVFGGLAASVAEHTENKRMRLISFGLTFWPNMTISNDINMKLWESKLEEEQTHWSVSFRKKENFQALSQLGISLITLVPTGALLIWIILENSSDMAKFAVLIAILPRVFQILLALHDLATTIYAWNEVKGRLSVLNQFFVNPDNDIEFRDTNATMLRIQYGSDVLSGSNRIDAISELKNGRVCISGPNGSGKTTFLLELKERLGDSSLFLPSSSELFFGGNFAKASTGQAKIYEIEAILELQDVPKFILLDEWDANLDTNNINLLEERIDQLAKRCVVVEVRHRQDGQIRNSQ